MRYLCHPLGEYTQDSQYDYYTYTDDPTGLWPHQFGKLDLNCREKPVYSMTNGIVSSIWTSDGVTGINIRTSDLGICKVTGKDVIIRYLHWNESYVSEGDNVKIGQKIALSGNQGSGGEWHLHIDMYWADQPGGASAANAVRMGPYRDKIIPYYPDLDIRSQDTIRLYPTQDRMAIGDYLLYHIFTQNIIKVSQNVPEDSHAAVIWNWFINANIPNVSNRPELIAGIIGNFQTESYPAIDVLGTNGTYYGPWCQSGTSFRDYMINAGFSFHPYTTNPSNASGAIPSALTWLTQNSGDWVNWFMSVINQVSSQTGEAGARAYAELFCVCIERCVEILPQYPGDPVLDSGVRQVVRNEYGTEHKYQGLNSRREHAAAIYNQFAK